MQIRYSSRHVAVGAALLAFARAIASTSSDTSPPPAAAEAATPLTYEITWHSTLPGVSHLRNSCFELSATAGQPTPGYSSGGTYVVSSGFWSAAPTSALDEIYFNGFEGCGS